MLIGYRRSSTAEQIAGFEEQEKLLLATGCSRVLGEMASSSAQRGELERALDWLREGDTLVVTRLDRLARSTMDLLSIVARLEAKCVGLRVLDFGGSEVDTKSPTGKMIVTMFGAVAEFEKALMKERQKAGIAKAKTEGRYKGRAPTARAKAAQILELKAQGIGASEIARLVGVSRASTYRIVAEAQS